MFIGEGEVSDAIRLSVIMPRTTATPEWAQETAVIVDDCPWAAATVWAGINVPFMFSLPADHRWWIGHIPEGPRRVVGLEHAELPWGHSTEVRRSPVGGTIRGCEGQAYCGAPCPGFPSHRQQREAWPAVVCWQPPITPMGS